MASKKADLQAALMNVTKESSSYAKTVSKKEQGPNLSGLIGADPHYQTLNIYDLEDAPKEWNPYPRIKDVNMDKYLELKTDIAANGLLEPIRVWSRNGKYMIVAGHNRKDILEELAAEYPEAKSMYEDVVCYVIGANEKTEEQIRNEIHVTNIRRDMTDIDKRTQMEILDDRIALLMENKTPKGEDILVLAEKMGIKKSNLYNQLTIRNDLLPDIKELYFSSKLSVQAAVKIASLNVGVQKYICDHYLDKLDTKAVKDMPKDIFSKGLADTIKNGMLDNFFSKPKLDVPTKKISVSIPQGREEEFKKLVEEWLKSIS